MVSVQEYVNTNYSKENRNKVTRLDISNKNLKGQLDLSDFINLEHLDCLGNKITSLEITKCSNLEVIGCSSNLLTELDLSQNIKLKRLEIDNNNFREQDLAFLSHLINLEWLELQNGNKEPIDNSWNIQKGIYNRFYGSLKFLKNMERLRVVDISDTDIDEGLEYLSDSIEIFACKVDRRKDARVKNIHNLLVNKQGKLELDSHSGVKNFSQKLQEYKQKNNNKVNNKNNMVNWKTYKITSKKVNSSSNHSSPSRLGRPRPIVVTANTDILFHLDDYVNYDNGDQKYIYCSNSNPFSSWREGDFIEIDNDITCCKSNGYCFGSTHEVRGSCNGHPSYDDLKDKYDKLEGEYNDLCERCNELTVQIFQKDVGLGELKEKMATLQVSLEGDKNEKLEEKEKEWGELVQKLGFGRQKPRELRKAYQQLFEACEDCNQDKIDEAEDKIGDIKDELDKKTSSDSSKNDVKKLYEKCEEVEKLRMEIKEIKQEQDEYEQSQQVPPYNYWD